MSPLPADPSSQSDHETTPLLGNVAAPRPEESIHRGPTSDDQSQVNMFWEELWILAKYALPVFGAHLLEYSLVIASVVSIGHISTTALAAISLGSMTAGVTGFSIIQGLASALDTLLPSAWTSPQPQLVGLWAQRMTIVMSISLVVSHLFEFTAPKRSADEEVPDSFSKPMFLIWFNAEKILIFFKQDQQVAQLAGIYLRWVSIGLPGLFMIPTRIVMVVAPINVLLNWLLVWGPEPFGLGFIGAPIATAISFNLISISSVLCGVFLAPHTAWHPISRRMLTGFRILVNLGLSGVGQTASEWWAWELVTLAASLLGPVALATQSVLLVSAATTNQAPLALSIASTVRIGNLLGEQKGKRAGVAANASIMLAFMTALIFSAMFLVFRFQWAYIFNSDPEVVKLVASILPLVALFQVFDGIAGVTAGILRAEGKQFLGALLNARYAIFSMFLLRDLEYYTLRNSAYYIFGIPLGVYLAFSKHYDLDGLWLGLTFSLVYCAVIGTWVCLRTDWDSQVRKVLQRLKEEDRRRVEDERRYAVAALQ
ncbi:hypothetical protein CVT26_008245 [Gymnopilus dilepis]|uniref:MATE efflux family protein n=1 Tax=Gymnopilus dilepis TaxID=231916 RepID=A0A409XXB5_9AGAR|nr:hypothetical protein CVT26_008245 [Gymnopilus dilepis]